MVPRARLLPCTHPAAYSNNGVAAYSSPPAATLLPFTCQPVYTNTLPLIYLGPLYVDVAFPAFPTFTCFALAPYPFLAPFPPPTRAPYARRSATHTHHLCFYFICVVTLLPFLPTHPTPTLHTTHLVPITPHTHTPPTHALLQTTTLLVPHTPPLPLPRPYHHPHPHLLPSHSQGLGHGTARHS